jgi:hypothetical protein
MTFKVLSTNSYESISALARKYKSKRTLKYLMRKNEMEIKETVFYKRKSERRGRKESDKIATNFFFFERNVNKKIIRRKKKICSYSIR